MSRRFALEHEFVEYIPETPDPGTIYVSIGYATAVHLCCCGCGSEVVTPISPVDWQLTFDGETVSLHPSIGNWSLPCRSHYWIRKNEVAWARPWTERQIAAGREMDRIATEDRYAKAPPRKNGEADGLAVGDDARSLQLTLWRRIVRALR
jgi:hypothetical protein